jgi:hypothetical protein
VEVTASADGTATVVLSSFADEGSGSGGGGGGLWGSRPGWQEDATRPPPPQQQQQQQQRRRRRRRRLRAPMVLVCTNGFTNFRPLLPMHLDLRLQTQTTVRFVLNGTEAAKLRNMPALVCKVSRVIERKERVRE